MALRCAIVAAAASAVTAATVTKTVYRITPRNYTGVTNLDTGDAAGDAFFGLYELQAGVLCTGSTRTSQASGLLCRNQPILQIPGFNVYEQFEIEMDTRTGDYAECNPSSDPPHDFTCTHFERSPNCWYNNPEHPEWATEFADVCTKSECQCDVIESKAVGSEKIADVFGRFNKVNKSYPATCSSEGFKQLMDYVPRGIPHGFPQKLSEADCCAACHGEGRLCAAYGYTYDTSTCQLYSVVFTGTPRAGASLGYIDNGGSNFTRTLSAQTAMLANSLNGTWYSTQAAGECQPGQNIGDGCYWRLLNMTSNVNSSCVNGNLLQAAIDYNPGCWKGCPQPTNTSSECWVGCLFDTVSGNPNSGTSAMPPSLLVEAFQQSFNSSAHGGCPQVPPCPSPCVPPAHAHASFSVTDFA